MGKKIYRMAYRPKNKWRILFEGALIAIVLLIIVILYNSFIVPPFGG